MEIKMKTIFNRPAEKYKSQIDPLQAYWKQLSFYLEKKYNLTDGQAKQKAKEIIKGNLKDKTIKFFQREENGDRTVQNKSLLQYINDTIKSGNILAPTFTTYKPKSQEKSIMSEFIAINVKRRSVAKKAGQKAKVDKDFLLAIAKNDEQNLMKIYNNSLSGAFAQIACILYNLTAHSTLTSVTRTVSSLANTSNEKIIAGNRYYPRPVDVLNNVVYIASKTDEQAVFDVCSNYNLHLPTVEETVSVLKYSSDLYFKNDKYYEEHVIPFLHKLSPYQLASICYTGDLYHIRVFNEDFMRSFINKFINKVVSTETDSKYAKDIHQVDENVLNYVHGIFYSEVRGKGKEYEKMEPTLTASLYHTSMNIYQQLENFKDFISVFFLSEIMPCGSNKIRNMRRRAVVLSDTDSTCFAVDKWVEWYNNGKIEVNDTTVAVGFTVAFITTQVIIHLLAQLSVNLNVDKADINVLAMKNEFFWTYMCPASVSKHYISLTSIQEGNVHENMELEIKGVHYKSSAVPKSIINHFNKLVENTLYSLNNNIPVSVTNIIREIISVENLIIDNVMSGNTEYLKKSKVKEKDAYKNASSPYTHYEFWQGVMRDKYGDIPEPPFDVIKINTTLKGSTKFKSWVNTIKDEEFKKRLVKWMTEKNKKDLPTIFLEQGYVASNGIPEEILQVINIDKIVLDITKQHRLFLETLGVVIDEKKLVKDCFFNL